MTRVGVVGHIEWVTFAVVEQLPGPGEIVHASESFTEAGGGGAVAAAQLARLAGSATFLTAVGDDEAARRSLSELRHRHGVEVHAAQRSGPQRRAFTHLDSGAERTITVMGERLVPHGDDPLPWTLLAGLDGVYITGGDAAAIRAARAARTVVATPRALGALRESGIELDVLVASASDPGEAYGAGALEPAPRVVVLTAGAAGGTWSAADGSSGGWEAAPLPGPPVDSYGCGDAFAAGLTFGLAARLPLAGALALAARCGAAVLCGRGAYAGQLSG